MPYQLILQFISVYVQAGIISNSVTFVRPPKHFAMLVAVNNNGFRFTVSPVLDKLQSSTFTFSFIMSINVENIGTIVGI
jgi:hypothetical protein